MEISIFTSHHQSILTVPLRSSVSKSSELQVTGQWKGVQAGGCANHRETWPNNPKYQLVLDSPSHLQVTLVTYSNRFILSV